MRRSCAPVLAISVPTSWAVRCRAVLYSGTDYVQEQRERRLMLAEMVPI